MTKKEILKIKAVLLYVINEYNGIDKLSLYKILYFANQKHLKDYGRPIIEDTFVAMKWGPVPSFVRDVTNLAESETATELQKMISDYIRREAYIFYAKDNADLRYLSASDKRCLDESIRENKGLSFGILSEKSHDYAYEKTKKEKGLNHNIDLIDIATAAGCTEGTIKYIQNNINFQDNINFQHLY